jgi:hypothetical protein
MTKEESKQMAELVAKEQKQVKELNKWKAQLIAAELDKDRDILDRFEAYKYRVDCENISTAKTNQINQYLNIHKNLVEQERKKQAEKLKPKPFNEHIKLADKEAKKK